MSINRRKAAVTRVQRCAMTLGGLSVVAGAALTFGLASPAAAQTSTETSTVAVQTLPALVAAAPATAAQAPKTDGMPMPHPHHMRAHHMRRHHMRPHHHHKCDPRHHGHWDHQGHEGHEDSQS